MKKIPEEVKKEILEKATLDNILREYHHYHKKKGTNYVMDCPKCGSKDRLEFNEKKSIAKCFKCDIGVKTPANYLQRFHDMSFGQALAELARVELIAIPDAGATRRRNESHQVPYVQTFLHGSGLNTGDIMATVSLDEKTVKEVPVYRQGTVDSAFQIVPGDDVIIHYYDLEGNPMQYYRKDRKGNPSGKPRPFYRVRYQHPNLHLDKYGNPVKYRSPYGSDTKVYINHWLRNKYRKSSKIKTLYIQEGEKKADKATKHGLISVGVMGIHNIASNKRLPIEFEAIIKRCQVENVVFVLDSDWQDLSSKIDSQHSADQRPKSFFRAVMNFRNHFYAFSNNDIYLNIYFGHVKPGPSGDKGIDDLFINSLRGKEDTLKGLCEKALIEPNGDGQWMQFYNITTLSEYKIREFWHLENIERFTEHYRERLIALPKFRYGSVEWRFNEKKELELAQPLMPPEQFWNEDIKKDEDGKVLLRKYSFNHKRCYTFLQNRGFYRLREPNNTFSFIRVEGNVARRVEPFQIKDFVVSFTEQLNKEDVENMLYRGGRMYLGPESLGNIGYTDLTLHSPSKNIQYLYFKDTFFKVTDEGIFTQEIKDLNGQVWKDMIIDFKPTLTEPLFSELHQITREDARENPQLQPHIGEYTVDFSTAGSECHFLQFLLNTSIYFDRNVRLEDVSLDEKFETSRHLLSKVTAFGYMLHRYRNRTNERAVVGMDGSMSEVGKSNGRSGKSLFGVALEQLVPTVTIPGKKRDLLEDKFLFEEVDQRTAVIFFDDVRVNFDFEFLFPYITGKFTMEKKGVGKMTLPPEYVQKFYIATNHALSGEGSSFEDRQFLLGFSNWYNSHHKPIDDFKVMFFDEWDERQWNLFYNFAATCLHIYFKHGLIEAPSEKLMNRKLRQEMGEQFLDWAEEYFSNPSNCNTRIYKDLLYQGSAGDVDHIQHGDGFLTKYSNQRRFTPIQKFKTLLKLFCKYKGYDFNPSAEGKDIKSGGKEYLEIYIPEEQHAQLSKQAAHESAQNELPI